MHWFNIRLGAKNLFVKQSGPWLIWVKEMLGENITAGDVKLYTIGVITENAETSQ